MQNATITFAASGFDRVRSHLLPENGMCEEAAFLFAHIDENPDELSLNVIDEMLIPPSGFVSRSQFFLELTDETRATVIKHAHDLHAGLIECHSHPTQRGACFSWSDFHGFDEFVPHVTWRLGGRPYAAIVFATDSVDALLWTRKAEGPVAIDAIQANGRLINPTRQTLANWSKIYERCSI